MLQKPITLLFLLTSSFYIMTTSFTQTVQKLTPLLDPLYPGTAVTRMLSARDRARSLSPKSFSQLTWNDARRKILWAAGLKDLTNVNPGEGYTGHSFNDWNHVDATCMLGSESHSENNGRVEGMAYRNPLGRGIEAASIPELGDGGTWSTCMMGCNKSPPMDVAHVQFKSRIAFKLVWVPPLFKQFVLVDDEGTLLTWGEPKGEGLPRMEERRRNYEHVKGSKYGVEAGVGERKLSEHCESGGSGSETSLIFLSAPPSTHPSTQPPTNTDYMSTLTCLTLSTPPTPTPYTPQPKLWHLSWHPSGKRLAISSAAYEDNGPTSPNNERGGRVFVYDLTFVNGVLTASTLSGVLNGPLEPADDLEKTWSDTIKCQDRTLRVVEYSPCSSLSLADLLAVGSFDGSIAIWQGVPSSSSEMNYTCLSLLEGHTSEIKSLSFSSTSTLLASSSRDHSIYLWEPETPSPLTPGDFDCISVLNSHTADVKTVSFIAGLTSNQRGRGSIVIGEGEDALVSSGYDDEIHISGESCGDWFLSQRVKLPQPITPTSSSSSSSNSEASVSIDDSKEESTVWEVCICYGGGRLYAARGDGSVLVFKCYSAEEFKSLEDNKSDKVAPPQVVASKKKRVEDNPTPSSNESRYKIVGILPPSSSSSSSSSNSTLSPLYTIHVPPSPSSGHQRIVTSGATGTLTIYREIPSSSSDEPVFRIDCIVNNAHGGGGGGGSKEINCVRWGGGKGGGGNVASCGDDGVVRIWGYEIG